MQCTGLGSKATQYLMLGFKHLCMSPQQTRAAPARPPAALALHLRRRLFDVLGEGHLAVAVRGKLTMEKVSIARLGMSRQYVRKERKRPPLHCTAHELLIIMPRHFCA